MFSMRNRQERRRLTFSVLEPKKHKLLLSHPHFPFPCNHPEHVFWKTNLFFHRQRLLGAYFITFTSTSVLSSHAAIVISSCQSECTRRLSALFLESPRTHPCVSRVQEFRNTTLFTGQETAATAMCSSSFIETYYRRHSK